MNNKKNILKKLVMTILTQHQKDLIFGTLLGDGNLQTFSKGNTWRYRALQKAEHKAYLFNKYTILQNLCSSPPIFSAVKDERTGNTYKRFYFNTLVDPAFNPYASQFYASGMKDVPSIDTLKANLTPRALAYFYMDDGSLKWKNISNACRFSTQNFSLEGVERIQETLKQLYDLKTSLNKRSLKDGQVGYLIAVPEKSALAFYNVIKPYIVDPMGYKIPPSMR